MLMAVYGSLRAGMNNHVMLDTAKFLGVETHFGFDMYSLGAYPYITRGQGSVTFEIYNVPKESAKLIERMELGAGYETDVIETEFGPATIYVYTPEAHASMRRRYNHDMRQVKSGDWRAFNTTGVVMAQELTEEEI